MRWISSMNSTSPGTSEAEDGGEVAGVLDGRAARHAQRPAALVRDDHRERGLAEPGRAREQDVVGGALLHRRGREQQLQLPAHARLADELREAARAQGALERELGLRGEHGVGEVEVAVIVVIAPSPSCWAGPSRASVRRSRAERMPPSRRIGRGHRLVDRLGRRRFSDQPSPVSAASTLSAAPPARTAAGALASVRRDELARERDGDELRGLRPDAADLAEHGVVVGLTAAATWLGLSSGQHAERRLRPDAGDADEQLEDVELVAVANPKRVSASSRTMRLVCTVTSCPSRLARAARAWRSREPDAADLDRRASCRTAVSTRPRREEITPSPYGRPPTRPRNAPRRSMRAARA